LAAGPRWVVLGSDELVTINQLVDLVEDIAGIKLKRRYNLNAPRGVNGRNSDNTRIKALLVPSALADNSLKGTAGTSMCMSIRSSSGPLIRDW
jgi:nucleoside-diphosphate-sugar epimerase